MKYLLQFLLSHSALQISTSSLFGFFLTFSFIRMGSIACDFFRTIHDFDSPLFPSSPPRKRCASLAEIRGEAPRRRGLPLLNLSDPAQGALLLREEISRFVELYVLLKKKYFNPVNCNPAGMVSSICCLNGRVVGAQIMVKRGDEANIVSETIPRFSKWGLINKAIVLNRT
jgi:hypothetical protein